MNSLRAQHEKPNKSHMKAYPGILYILLVALIGTGCNSIRAYPKRAVTESRELQRVRHYFTDDVVQIYYTNTTDGAKREYRNEVVNGRLRGIDLQFEVFEKAINCERN